MFAFGICRLDAGAEGIHLAWNVPEGVSLSTPGFDLQRRLAGSGVKFQCVALAAKDLIQLRATHALTTALGTLLCRQSGPLSPLLPSGAPWPTPTSTVDVFTLELSVPTDQVKVSASIPATLALHPFAFLVVAMSRGKVVATASGPGDGTTVLLTGSGIDSVAVYSVSAVTLTVCTAYPLDQADGSWATVPYLVRGLTLPIHEADPTLANPTAELSAAQLRLTSTETFVQADFDNLTPALRQAVAASGLGRAGERILLSRSTLDDPFNEITFSDQLALLQIHPRLRRVLGFGYFDHQSSGLVAGQSYEYRVTGHFDAQDVSEKRYDVRTIPSLTMLPATFRIADVRFSFPHPVSVILDPTPPENGLSAVSRRGIQLVAKSSLPGWLGPSLDDWSVVMDFPVGLTSVILETNAAQQFRYAAGDPWLFPATAVAAPPGPLIKLNFATPVTQLRLSGAGTLFAVRVATSTQTGVVPVVANSGPVLFAAQPLPVAPLSLTLANLQTPPGVATLSTNQGFSRGPQRPLPGFTLTWLPATTGNLAVWPPGTNAAPPIDAIAFQIEHREVTLPATFGPWEPIQPGDNLVLGTRDNIEAPIDLIFGADLAQLFPGRRPRAVGAAYTFHLSDVFELNDSSDVFSRPLPAFGTLHQYQIRAMDTVGRLSANWTLSNLVRLEKHQPPPLPTGPQPEPLMIDHPDGTSQLSGVPGVKARVLVVGDPTLNAIDRAVLGSHRNAIVLDWGWREAERAIDALTQEFRVYYWLTPPDAISGTITAVAAVPGGWSLNFQTNQLLQDGECVGQWVTTGGYPFQITTLTGGANPVLQVSAALASPTATPAMGAAQFGRPLSTEHQRPASWDQRVAVIPLTAAESYQYVFYDLLNLTPAHPLDSIWVGVSAADAEAYVVDELPPAVSNGGRPGNECSIVTYVVMGRDRTQPVLTVPPPIGDVPELIGEEPTGRQILVALDLPAALPGALAANEPIGLERCAVETILSITSLNPANQIELRMLDGTSQTISYPNPEDEAAVVAMLQSANPERVATRYLLYLATQHARPDEIFEATSGATWPFGVVTDRLAPKPARYFYRVRRADALRRLSAGGAILPLVVRVPSTAPPAAPTRVALTASTSAVALTLQVPNDPDLTYLLVFSTTVPLSTPLRTDLSGAELLRTPNRRDLYPQNGIRLRAPGGGALLSPIAKALTDPDVTADADGNLSATITIPATFGNWVVLWAFALSRDGIPSRVSGPFTIGAPAP
jgi:hypothetical protein